MFSIFPLSVVYGVESIPQPNFKPTFVMIDSTNCPIVIRLGIACGLIIISGFTPSLVNGISHSGIIAPIVPFCPHLEQNLSPIDGILCSRIRTFAIRFPSISSVI